MPSTKEQILDQIETVIRGITSIRYTQRHFSNPYEMGNRFPAVMIQTISRTVEHSANKEEEVTLLIYIFLFVKEMKEPETVLDEMFELIWAKLYADTTWGGLATNTRIMNVEDTGSGDIFGHLGLTAGVYPPYAGLRIDVEIQYFKSFS